MVIALRPDVGPTHIVYEAKELASGFVSVSDPDKTDPLSRTVFSSRRAPAGLAIYIVNTNGLHLHALVLMLVRCGCGQC